MIGDRDKDALEDILYSINLLKEYVNHHDKIDKFCRLK